MGRVGGTLAFAIVPAALAVACVGFIDDRSGVPARTRFLVHLGASLHYVAAAGGPPVLGIFWLDAIPWLEFLLTVLSLVWLLNLFNFMDGIDGVAGAQLAFVSFGLAFVAFTSGKGHESFLFATVLGSAALGFLAWNWPPAKIFMGDVGSGFAGVVVGMLALETIRECGITIWVPAILLGVFVTDATYTLLSRVLRGEKWYTPHRTHAYQWLSRRWGGHRPVLLAVLSINFIWLLPLAVVAQRFPRNGWLVTIAAYVPLIVLAVWAGAGRPEHAPPAVL